MTFLKKAVLSTLINSLFFVILTNRCSETPALRTLCLESICKDILVATQSGKTFYEVFMKIQQDFEKLPAELADALQKQLGKLTFRTVFPHLIITSHSEEITSLTFDHNKNILVSTSRDKRIKWFDLEKNFIESFPSGPLIINGLDSKPPLVLTTTLSANFSHNNTYLVGTETGHIGIKIKDFSYYCACNNRKITSICGGQEESHILLSTEKRFFLFDTETKVSRSLGVFQNKKITAITCSPKYNLCAAGFNDGSIDVYHNYRKILQFAETTGSIIFLHFLNDKLIAADKDGSLISWEVDEDNKRKFLIKLISADHQIRVYTISSDEMFHAFADENKLYLQNTAEEYKDSPVLFSDIITHLAFNYDATLLAASDFKGNIYLSPLPQNFYSLEQVLILLFLNALKIHASIDKKIIKQLLKLIKKENIQSLFNPTILSTIKYQLKIIKRERQKKRYTDTAKKILRLGFEK